MGKGILTHGNFNNAQLGVWAERIAVGLVVTAQFGLNNARPFSHILGVELEWFGGKSRGAFGLAIPTDRPDRSAVDADVNFPVAVHIAADHGYIGGGMVGDCLDAVIDALTDVGGGLQIFGCDKKGIPHL